MRLSKNLIAAAAFALAASLLASPASAVPVADSFTFVVPPSMVTSPNAGFLSVHLTNPNNVPATYTVIAEDLNSGPVDALRCSGIGTQMLVQHLASAVSQGCGTSLNGGVPPEITIPPGGTDEIQIGLVNNNVTARRVQIRYEISTASNVGGTGGPPCPGPAPCPAVMGFSLTHLLAEVQSFTTNQGLLAFSQTLTRDSLR